MLFQNLSHRSSCFLQIRKKIIISSTSSSQNRIAAMSTTARSNSSLSLFHNFQIDDGRPLSSLRMYDYQTNNFLTNQRKIHSSTIRQNAAAKNDVTVTLETASSASNNNHDSSTSSSSSTSGDNGSSCSQGIPLGTEEEEEEEQEEMFVTADPILGHGAIQEWGGPRRGGTLAEPTRFGDWERKGRCTDF